ncbi:MAG: hypothetical protein JXB14_07480 [Candidatus Altiarchaeota archaeon]|nr:hypothetical protein [Candidatus Altiarchaeota archaeon]
MEERRALGWEYDAAYKLVDLYVKELIERHDKRALDLEGIVEAYLYVLGRLRASEAEIDHIAREVKKQLKEHPPEDRSGIKEAVGEKKLSAGLLKALEGL